MENKTKLIQLKRKLEVLALAGSLALGAAGCGKTNEDIEKPVFTPGLQMEMTTSENIDSVEENKYSFVEISEIIDSNNNLTNEEKKFIKELKFVFDDNHEYMDLDMIKERLSTLKINYSEEACETDSTIGGTYAYNENIITIYYSKDFDSSNMNTFVHEFLHVLQKDFYSYTSELSNELFSRETVRRLYEDGKLTEKQISIMYDSQCHPKNIKKGTGYEPFIALYYLVAEISPEENLREYQFGSDILSLEVGLASGSNQVLPEEPAKNFINCINNSKLFKRNEGYYEKLSDVQNTVEECAEYLDYYYVEKYGHSFKEDIDVSILFYGYTSTLGQTYTPYSDDSNEYISLEEQLIEEAQKQVGEDAKFFGFHRTINPKTYLSKRHLHPVITFNSLPFVAIEIDDEFKNQYNNKLSKKQKSLTLENNEQEK